MQLQINRTPSRIAWPATCAIIVIIFFIILANVNIIRILGCPRIRAYLSSLQPCNLFWFPRLGKGGMGMELAFSSCLILRPTLDPHPP